MDFDPPLELTLPARRHWDRLAKEIHGQGRWPTVSQDMLATFSQTLVLAQEAMQQILADGVLVSVPVLSARSSAIRCLRL